MEHIPLIPKIQKPCTDISHVIREIFQNTLEQDALDKMTLENLKRNCVNQETFKDEYVLYTEIHTEHKAIMDEITSIEEQLMSSQERAMLDDDFVQKNEVLCEQMKLKTMALTEEYHGEMTEYLIRSRDLLPPIHERELNFQLKSSVSPYDIIQETEARQITKLIRKSKSSLPPISQRSSFLQTQILKPQRKKKQLVDKIRPPLKRKKPMITPVIFQAVPDCVVFTNYAISIKYEKCFKLKNVSNMVGRFDLVPLPVNSKFLIEWELLPGKNKMVAPGLSVTVKVLFCTDSLEDKKEQLFIPVLGGRPVTVTLLAYREAPQLRVVELRDIEETLLPEKQKVLCTTVECGQCMVGATVNTTIRLHNQGGEARFWLLSEEDWCFSSVQNVSNYNVIKLPPFFISPSYFTVNKGGIIDINIKFCPETYGLQVEKLYVVCDNCSFRELELIGDAFLYEDYFITIEDVPKTFQIDIEDDINAEYYLDLGNCTTTGKVKGAFSAANNSPIQLQYFWRNRKPNIKCPKPPEFKSLDEGDIYISPQMGHFRALESETFTIFLNTKRTEVGNYRHIFQLYIASIPPECLSKSCHPLKIEPTKQPEIRVTGCIDILIKEIEIWVQVVPVVVKLEPCVINITGNKILCDSPPLIRTVNITNGSDSPLTCVWEAIPNFGGPATAMCCVMSMTPAVLRVYPRTCSASKLSISVITPGRQVEKYQCIINEGEHILELSIEIEVEDPIISPSTHLLDFGLVKYGTFAELPISICNKSASEVIWKIQEFLYHPEWKLFQILEQDSISSNMGYLCHEGSISNLWCYLNTRRHNLWGSLLGMAIMSTERAMPNYFQDFILIIANIISPQLKIEAPPYINAILIPHGLQYLGKEIECSITLKNLTQVPATFKWEMPIGKDAYKLKVKFCPQTGTVKSIQKMEIIVNIIPIEIGVIEDYYVTCTIGRVRRPIVLAIKTKVSGLNVTFHIPSDTSKYDGSCIQHRLWTVDDKFIFPNKIKSDHNISSGDILDQTDEISMSTMCSICSDTRIEPVFSQTEFEGESDNFERKKNIRKLIDKKKTQKTSEQLLMTIKSQYFDYKKTINSESHIETDEEIDAQLNEFYAFTSTQEICNSEKYPEIDFIPQFPLSKPANLSSDGNYFLKVHSDSKNSSFSALTEEQQREMSFSNNEIIGSSTLAIVTESNPSLSNVSGIINDITMEGSTISAQSLQKSKSVSLHEEVLDSKRKRHFSKSDDYHDMETIVQSVEDESIIEGSKMRIQSEDISPTMTEKGSSESETSLASLHEFPYASIPVINFYNVPCHQPIKKTLIIQNETPICTNFTVNISNFNEQENTAKPSMNEQIQMKIAGKKVDLWKYMIQEKAGIVIKVEPSSSELGPYEVISVNIWVYADTWGIYTDQIVCHISGLSPFYVELKVHVVGFPLSFPMSYGNIQNKAILRFGTLAYRGLPQIRKVKIRNDSSVCIFVNWHVFLTNDNLEKQQPFSVVLDIFNTQKHNFSEKNLSSRSNTFAKSLKDMRLNITPYHGLEDFRIFQVSPEDICIPPKGESHFFIRANPIICKPNISESLHIKAIALAYLRISDYDSKKEGIFVRPSGIDLEPVILNMEMTIQVPLFSMHHTLGDLTFKVYATDVVCGGNDVFPVHKRLMFTNKNEASLTGTIEASKPFEVTWIKTPDSSIKHRPSKQNVTLNFGQSAEVHLECVFTRKHVDKASEVLKNNSSSFSEEMFIVEKVIIFKGQLYLRQPHLLVQTVPLWANIIFPCLVIKPEMLDFGPVFVTKIKTLLLNIENKSNFWVTVNLSKKFNTEEYIIEPIEANLPPAPASGNIQTEFRVFFQPSDTKDYMDRILIKTCIPGDCLEVSLTGVGTFNSRTKFTIEI
ncbi:hypothetical protein C0J52_16136 [Blattella germanica]|nr:hypothetical protein C0J52_16136 [Blattella germanica]